MKALVNTSLHLNILLSVVLLIIIIDEFSYASLNYIQTRFEYHWKGIHLSQYVFMNY